MLYVELHLPLADASDVTLRINAYAMAYPCAAGSHSLGHAAAARDAW
ncbi:MAG: hypothetical protein SOY94_00295 [Candidatus Limiplasma sp.]|nr:hypothetical protein [Candidatus Limiplasma sp.]